jgi:hypothetical protein
MTVKIARVTLGILLVLCLSLLLLSQNAQETYQRALVQEQAAGKLPQAIELYLQAAKDAGKDRALAAKALIHAAGAQEKLGQPGAENLYSEVMRAYPEQLEQVNAAKLRLASLTLESPLKSIGAGLAATDVSSVASPMFEQYCIRCHNQTTHSAGLSLDTLNTKNVGENTAVWESVLRRLRARRDPPVGLARPDDKTYQSVVARLESALDQAYPTNTPSTADRATDEEIAARMATFIWGSAPDAPLLEDARQGKLHDPAVLDRQVKRMLQDPKSANLVVHFFEPKFNLDSLLNSRPDPANFPDFDTVLLQWMNLETRMFLDNQIREDHSALEIWTANYTFLNDRLARHYGIPDISGAEYRRVTLPGNTRAGLLGQGSVLTVTSQSNRTSPVSRGVWVLKNVFGVNPPDPPPNVPALRIPPGTPAGTMREMMAAHAANPACSSCHAIFDPLGLALENFDAIGRWRITDGGSAIDTSGAFPDGTRFTNPAEFRTGLLKFRDAYYSSMTQQLFGFALGRKARTWRVYDYEMPSVRAIVKMSAANDYRWSSIISGIVKSAPFQMKNIVP